MREATISIDRGTVRGVAGPGHSLPPLPPTVDVLDAGTLSVMPGFIDVHVHGWGGVRMDSADGVRRTASSLAQRGCTAFLPTLTGQPTLERLLANVADVADAVGPQPDGATVLGIHLEGPFLNPHPRVRGAQHPDFMRAPSLHDFDRIVEAARGHLRYMTLAPELAGALDVVAAAARNGVVIGAGHTNATYAEAMAGFDAGIASGIHTYNGMSGFHHREPGMVGAILATPHVVAELIADLVHVSVPAASLLIRIKGADHVALITDAVQFAGMPDGRYRRDDGRETVKAGRRCELADGHLAGSVTGMEENVGIVSGLPGCDLAMAARMASTTPARLIGVGGRKGRIAPGADADLVGVDPDGVVRLIVIAGRVVPAGDATLALARQRSEGS
jgi:N-acetylglucosamine-6-phosphate deacetylase